MWHYRLSCLRPSFFISMFRVSSTSRIICERWKEIKSCKIIKKDYQRCIALYILHSLLTIVNSSCMVYIRKKNCTSKHKSGLSAREDIHFGQRRQPLVPMLRWIIVLSLQQRCKDLRNDASSQLEAIDAVWCKLKEFSSQMQNKRSINAGLEAISESQLRRMQPVHTDDSHDRTLTVHVRFFLFFSEKNQNVCVRTTRNIDIKNDGLI